MNERVRIYVAGHRGLVGSALVRALRARGVGELTLRTREELDLTDERAVEAFFREERPTHVFDAAARVGGIADNASRPAEFLLQNLRIQTNLIRCAFEAGAEKFLFLGSSSLYPPAAPQPLHEDSLLTGPLEPTHEAYAIAKIAGLKLCQAYRRQHGFRTITLMPTNLYGPGDNFDLETAHVLPALLRRFHEAREVGAPRVVLWGSGSPRRELLHVDDLADAALFLMERYDDSAIINVGTGEDLSIAELAGLVRDVVGYRGEIEFDAERPDGAPRKLLDVSRLSALGWRPGLTLEEGIRSTYRWYAERAAAGSGTG